MSGEEFRCSVCGATITDDVIESAANMTGRTVPEVITEFRLAGCLAVRMRHTGYTGGVEA